MVTSSQRMNETDGAYLARLSLSNPQDREGALRIRIDAALAKVKAEVMRAMIKHPTGMRSNHEGYAVILEELDELWDDVKHDRTDQAIAEAVQVAAMGVRFMLDREGSK